MKNIDSNNVYLNTEIIDGKHHSKITIKWLQMFNFDEVPGRVTNFMGLLIWIFYSVKLWFTIEITWIFALKFIWSSTVTISGFFILKLVGKVADDFYKDVKPPIENFIKRKFNILSKFQNNVKNKKTQTDKTDEAA